MTPVYQNGIDVLGLLEDLLKFFIENEIMSKDQAVKMVEANRQKEGGVNQ